MPKLPEGIFKRGPSYYYRERGGGKDRKRSLGKDFTLACMKLREIRAGRVKPFDRVTVKSATAQWLSTYVMTTRSPKNVKVTASRIKRYMDPFLGYMRADEVVPDDLRRYRLWLEKQGIGTQTVAHVLADARCCFRWCEEMGYVSRAPIPRRLLPRVQEQLPRALSIEEVEAVLRLPDPWRFVIRLGLATGLRWSEMCRAEAKHLTRDGWLTVENTKSGRARRVPLADTDPELCREVGRRVGKLIPYGVNSVGTFNRRVRLRTGLAKFSHHQLRHTFATCWLEHGGNIVALQDVLGHSDIKLTQRYARVTANFVRAEARRQAAGNLADERPDAGTLTGTLQRNT